MMLMEGEEGAGPDHCTHSCSCFAPASTPCCREESLCVAPSTSLPPIQMALRCEESRNVSHLWGEKNGQEKIEIKNNLDWEDEGLSNFYTLQTDFKFGP